MKNNIILNVKNHNWSEIGPGDWISTEWKISEDLSVEIIVEREKDYINENEDDVHSVTNVSISKRTLRKMFDQIEKAKGIDIEVDADDGEAWEFIEYNDGEIVWKRKIGYIYGITPLERIAQILEHLTKRKILKNCPSCIG